MADRPTRRERLGLREWSTGPVGQAEAVVDEVAMGRRVLGALVPLGAALGLALLLLPVPLMHLAGIPIVAAGGFIAYRNLRARSIIASATGTCPGCGTETKLFLGFGRTPYRLPIKTSCEACGRPLTLVRPE